MGPAQAPSETTGYDGMDTPDVQLVNDDRDGVIIEWSEPVQSHQEDDPDEFLYIVVSYNGPEITLRSGSSHMDQITSVRYYRWDFQIKDHVDIATIAQSPFSTTISPRSSYAKVEMNCAPAGDEEGNDFAFPSYLLDLQTDYEIFTNDQKLGCWHGSYQKTNLMQSTY